MSKKFLFVIDMQNDFIDGSLPEAMMQKKRIVPNVVKLIQNWGGVMIKNMLFGIHMTHYELIFPIFQSIPKIHLKAKMLPVKHCIETPGLAN